jgi:SAM-dependent methyltransferase
VPQALARLIPIDAGFEFVDLGCGLGGTLATLARLRPDGCFHGVEVAPLPFAVSALRALASGGQVQVRYGDFWKLDLAHYDVVYAFLSPVPMPRLWQKARAQMRPGTLLVSNSFEVPGVNPHATLRLDDRRGSALHVWRM